MIIGFTKQLHILYIHREKKTKKKQNLRIFRLHPKRPHIKSMNDSLNLNSEIAGVTKMIALANTVNIVAVQHFEIGTI